MALIVMSDIAIYSDLNAQPTSGAGAVALLIGIEPKIIVHPQRSSNFMNAFDFYKPQLEHDYPTVNGKLSTDLYIKSLILCWDRFKKQNKESNFQKLSLKDFDFFCFHCPFTKQVRKAFLALFFNELKTNSQFAKEFNLSPKNYDKVLQLSKKGVSFYNREIQKLIKPLFKKEIDKRLEDGLILPTVVGNIYTGSLYLSLISIFFANRNNLINLKNKKIMLYSYGSGLTSSLLNLEITNSDLSNLVDFNRIENELKMVNLISCKNYFKIQKKNEKLHGRNNFQTILYKNNNLSLLSEKIQNQLWSESFYLSSVSKSYIREYVYLGKDNKFKYFIQPRTNFLEAMKLSNISKKLRLMTIENRQEHLSKKFENYSLIRHLKSGGLTEESADNMTENCIGRIALPLSVVEGLILNGKEYTVPMCTEEASVVAAANRSLKTIRELGGGFWGYNTRNVIRGQIYVIDFQSLSENTFYRKTNDSEDFNINSKFSRKKNQNSLLSKNLTKNLIDSTDNLSSLTLNSGFESKSLLESLDEKKSIKLNNKDSSKFNEKFMTTLKNKQKTNIFINIPASIQNILKNKNKILSLVNEKLCPGMYKLGGGAFDLYCKLHDKTSFSISLLLDVVDAMGANTINTTLEGLKPFIMSKLILKKKDSQEINMIDSSPILMSICSNLCPERVTRVGFKVPVKSFSYSKNVKGLEVCQRICMAARIAKLDLFRAVTHNKGIMNGVIAVLMALGQDTRAVEAGCHVYSIYRNGQYQSLSDFYMEDNGQGIFLCGELEIPLSIGTVGGVLAMNPLYKSFLNNMKIKTSKELSQVVACIGLANNLAALRALVTEGIQKGHMKLHAKNLALSVGVPMSKIEEAVTYMEKINKFTMQGARNFVKKKLDHSKNIKKNMLPKL